MTAAIKQVATKSEGPQFVFGATLLGFGFERITKAVLWDVNPLYTLKDPSFKNSAGVLYKKRFPIPDLGKDIVSPEPNADTITLRESILRASAFSKEIHDFRATFYTACKLRDIGAHCDLELPEVEELRQTLLRHLGPLLKRLAGCGILQLNDYSERDLERIDNISDILETDERINILLTEYQNKWAKLMPSEQEKKRALKYAKRHSDGWSDTVECPACHESARLCWEVDYDIVDGQGFATGCYVDRLEYKHCDLSIEDLEDISWLGFPIDHSEISDDYLP
ncbi:MAG: hypothetical protein ABL974_17180 [Prosthecobacter sp.]